MQKPGFQLLAYHNYFVVGFPPSLTLDRASNRLRKEAGNSSKESTHSRRK